VLGPFLGLVLITALFAWLTRGSGTFMSVASWQTIAVQTVVVGTAALGMTAIMVSGGIDLSVGSTVALVTVCIAMVVKWLQPQLSSGLREAQVLLPAAMVLGILLGGLCGAINGMLISSLRVVPFIVTLGMLGIARGVAKWLAREQTVNVPATWLNDLLVTFPKPAWLLLPIGVWATLALAALAALVLGRTVFGRRVFALGSNEAAARACGVDTGRLRIAIYGIAGCLFGLTGVMQMSRLRQGDPTVANGAELDIIAAVVIGGGSLSGGEGSIAGSIIGALIMAFLRNGCQQMGWPNYIQEIIIGVIIVLAVALDRVRATWAERSAAAALAAGV
jgi:ribose transport system permease protein